MKRGPKRQPVFERFWHKASFSDGCWEWRGAKSLAGYAQMRDAGKTLYAHRLSYETLVAKVEDGLHLDHLCRNRGCVNPLHLEPVTCRENLLRGAGPTAIHAQKTHCPKGHAYNAENTIEHSGKRRCRTCHYAANRNRYSRLKGKV